jgi:hypothetical protein
MEIATLIIAYCFHLEDLQFKKKKSLPLKCELAKGHLRIDKLALSSSKRWTGGD